MKLHVEAQGLSRGGGGEAALCGGSAFSPRVRAGCQPHSLASSGPGRVRGADTQRGCGSLSRVTLGQPLGLLRFTRPTAPDPGAANQQPRPLQSGSGGAPAVCSPELLQIFLERSHLGHCPPTQQRRKAENSWAQVHSCLLGSYPVQAVGRMHSGLCA